MRLIQSRVEYNRASHEYWLDGKKLQGITGMIKNQLFPHEYDNVSEEVLKRAAERGSAIHDEIEFADKFGDFDSTHTEVAEYVRLRNELNLVHEDSEYIVSDYEHFASPIDKVYRVSENEFILADIKTTSKYNSEYVRWQLSIYASFFEMNNPECKVVGLYGIWLPKGTYGKPKFQKEERIDNSIVQDLLRCEIEGKQFVNPFAITEEKSGVPQRFIDMTNFIVETARLKKFYADQEKQLIAEVNEAMVESNVYGWKTDKFNFVRKHDSQRSTFDLEAFKKDYPDLPYGNYMKVTEVKGSVSLKIYE